MSYAADVRTDVTPHHVFHAVDIDVALKAGYIDGLPDKVQSVPEAKKRPDYFLVGRPRDGRSGAVHVVVLECKGTHGDRSDVVKQLGDACLQVRTVSVGKRRLYGLMAGSRLAATGITTYLLDPPGDDELWTGSHEEFEELLRGRPEELHLEPDLLPVPARDPGASSEPADEASASGPEPVDSEPPEPPAHYEIPGERRGWFAQILTRSAAASALLYAGDSTTAAEYATPRQRGYDLNMIPGLEESWEGTVGARMPLRACLRTQQPGLRFSDRLSHPGSFSRARSIGCLSPVVRRSSCSADWTGGCAPPDGIRTCRPTSVLLETFAGGDCDSL